MDMDRLEAIIEIGFWQYRNGVFFCTNYFTRIPNFSLHKTFLKASEEQPILNDMNEITDGTLVILVANQFSFDKLNVVFVLKNSKNCSALSMETT